MAAIVGAAGLASCLAAATRRQAPAARQQGSAGRRRRAVRRRGASRAERRCCRSTASTRRSSSACPPIARAGPACIDHIVLTASGGPFRGRDPATLGDVTPDRGLRPSELGHGPQDLGRLGDDDEQGARGDRGALAVRPRRPSRSEVVIHPQSVIHSMVVCRDSSVLAQLGTPDMRVPIAYGLAWPERIASGTAPLDLREARRAHVRRRRPRALSRPRASPGRRCAGRPGTQRRAQCRERGSGRGLPRRNHPLRPDSQCQRAYPGGTRSATRCRRFAAGPARPRCRSAAARRPVPRRALAA